MLLKFVLLLQNSNLVGWWLENGVCASHSLKLKSYFVATHLINFLNIPYVLEKSVYFSVAGSCTLYMTIRSHFLLN